MSFGSSYVGVYSMSIRSKFLLVALSVAAVLAMAVGTAAANRFALSNSNIRAAFPELTFFSGESNVICPVTIEGSFHSRTITKTVNSLIGYISRAIVDLPACRGIAKATVNAASLPWHVRYAGFTGRLPTIASIVLILNNVEFTLLEIPIIGSCRYRGTAEGSVIPAATSTTISASAASEIPRTAESSVFCPSPGHFRGTARVTLLGTATDITVRLI